MKKEVKRKNMKNEKEVLPKELEAVKLAKVLYRMRMGGKESEECGK